MPLNDLQLSGKEVRLFPSHHIKSDREAELRATAAFLAVACAVSEFGKVIVSLAGGPKGRIRSYTEVPFITQTGPKSCEDRPDGILRSTFGKKDWMALVEVKVGNNALEQEQFDRYHTLANDHQIDALITISNQAALAKGLPPGVKPDAWRLKKVPVIHLSWERLLSEAQLLSRQKVVADSDQQWMLEEWIRYLEDDNSRIIEKPQLGEYWNTILQHAREGNLNACRNEMQDVVNHWDAFLRKAAFRLRAKLGVDVVLRMSKAEHKDTALRIKSLLDTALTKGQLAGEFRIPDAAGDLSIAVLLSSRLMQCSISLNAPTEGKAVTRIKWLLKQLQSAAATINQAVPDNLLVQVNWGWGQSSQATFAVMKDRIDALLFDSNGQQISKDVQPRSFTLQLTRSISKGKGRSTIPVLEDMQKGIEEFYSCIVERLRPFVPKAPELEGGYRPENAELPSIVAAKKPEDFSEKCATPQHVVGSIVAPQEVIHTDSSPEVVNTKGLTQQSSAENDSHGP